MDLACPCDASSSLGHTFIDVLKVDIEGGEFDALTSFIDAHADLGELPIGQLQLEIHARDGRERFDYFNHWWTTLEAAGLRPFWTEPNLVYINLVRGALPDLSEVRVLDPKSRKSVLTTEGTS
jgi:Methyltransferase FkbM domain